MAYQRLDECETLGQDDRWYDCVVREKYEDGTYRVRLCQFDNVTWIHVPAWNIRKRGVSFKKLYLHKYSNDKDRYHEESMHPHMFPSFGQSGNLKRSAEIQQFRKLAPEETFSEFDEPIPSRRLIAPTETFSEFEEENCKAMEIPDLILGSDSDVDESGGGPLSPISINSFDSMRAQCAYDLSSFKTRERSEDFSSFKTRERSDDLFTSNNNMLRYSTEWSQTRLDSHRADLESEIRRLKAHGYEMPTVTITEAKIDQSDLDISRSNLENDMSNTSEGRSSLSVSYVPSERSSLSVSYANHSSETPGVLYTYSGHEVEFARRRRGDTYYTTPVSLQERIDISAEFDTNADTIRENWRVGEQVEVWADSEWRNAVLVKTSGDFVIVLCSEEEQTRKLHRFGSDLRPVGYVEPESDSESDVSWESVVAVSEDSSTEEPIWD